MEEWRNIEEFEGFLISTKGRCFSQKTNKMLKIQKYPNGYLFFSFKIKGKQYTRLIHRLVAKASRKKVYMYSIDDGKLEAVYNSITEAAEQNKCFVQNICSCCKGKIKQCKGHKWSYEPL